MSMKYSSEQLEMISIYASNLMLPSEIATLLNIDEQELLEAIRNKQSDASRAYRVGKTETTLAIRRQEVELAKMSSPLAVQNVAKYISQMDTEEDG